MRMLTLIVLLTPLVAGVSPAALIVSHACQRVGPVSPDEICLKADAVVRASAVDYVRAPEGELRELNVPGKVSIRFIIHEVLKGNDLPREIVINGYLTDSDDFNDRPVPYDFVRPEGRHGNCSAYSYRRGAEFLLFVKQSGGELTPYWDALSPTNEQLHSNTDPWISWVKARLRSLEKERGKSHRPMLPPEIIKTTIGNWLAYQMAA